uniref:Uncharacterized protein n=1 Tax=Rhizophora mucronata TaxID=61149 RepID=A0A2P2QZH7_RHIMU
MLAVSSQLGIPVGSMFLMSRKATCLSCRKLGSRIDQLLNLMSLLN